jgi:hypothetical protein
MKRLRAAALAAALFLAPILAALAADPKVLAEYVGDDGELTIGLTKDECPPNVKLHIRAGWPYPTMYAVINYQGRKIDACYSVLPQGLSFVDEFGYTPGQFIPLDVFVAPGKPRGTPI